MFNDVGKVGCCSNEGVGRGNGWIGEVFVFEEHCCGNASATCGRRPYFPAPVVLGGCANDPSFGAVLSIVLAFMGFVMHQGLHTKLNKW